MGSVGQIAGRNWTIWLGQAGAPEVRVRAMSWVVWVVGWGNNPNPNPNWVVWVVGWGNLILEQNS